MVCGIKLRTKEEAKVARIETDAEFGLRHHMAGFAFYKEMQRKHAERKRIHWEYGAD